MFDWTRYLNLAQELAERSEEECKRAAISRAYYAAFCTAYDFLKKKGLELDSKSSAHFAVWNTFRLVYKGKGIDVIGDRLRKKRVQVDYENNVSGLNGMTKIALKEADQILGLVSSLDTKAQ